MVEGYLSAKDEQYKVFSSNTIPIKYQGSSIAIQYQCNNNAILDIFTTRCSDV
jgi:hypothetical protein